MQPDINYQSCWMNKMELNSVEIYEKVMSYLDGEVKILSQREYFDFLEMLITELELREELTRNELEVI